MARLPENARLWLERAEIDYIGPFVKAWAAFNAWYRNAANTRKDFEGLRYVKSQVNPIRGRVLPLLRPRANDENGRFVPDSEEAAEFKALIRNLHSALEVYHLEVDRDEVLERVSFRSVCLTKGVDLPKLASYRQHNYRVDKAGPIWTCTISQRANNNVTGRITTATYSIDEFQAAPEYVALTPEQRAQCLSLYQSCNPRPKLDLLNGHADPIDVGDLTFRCTPEQLLAGLIEVIYGMRNALLHGELHPNEEAFKAYEHAYRIILKLLDCLRN